MSRQLRAEIEALPLGEWQFWKQEKDGAVREWAEVPFVPSRENEQRDTKPYRYLAVRIRTAQGVLFGDGNTVKYFAIVSNDWKTGGQALIEWQRGKAGTIEHVHLVLKDELAAGVYPSAKFGVLPQKDRLVAVAGDHLQPVGTSQGDGLGKAISPRPTEATAVCDLHADGQRRPPC